MQLPAVSEQQCEIAAVDDAVHITNLSTSHPTKVNSKPLSGTALLNHGDMIGIVDRCFRFEYPDGHSMAVTGKHC